MISVEQTQNMFFFFFLWWWWGDSYAITLPRFLDGLICLSKSRLINFLKIHYTCIIELNFVLFNGELHYGFGTN
jgi:hypothetical protein